MRAMRDFEKDAANFSFSGGDIAVSEISELSYSFGHMSKKIKELMEQIKKDETALRRTELRALQAQINPHFLYNTLSVIGMTGLASGNTDVSDMCTELSQLLRYSLSYTGQSVLLSQEIDNARHYLYIMKIRYEDDLKYEWQLDDRAAGEE